jgi:hypothetical protein
MMMMMMINFSVDRASQRDNNYRQPLRHSAKIWLHSQLLRRYYVMDHSSGRFNGYYPHHVVPWAIIYNILH